tara:strand:+ start:3096 stop:3767 length:672 start_codon:yes stop_codon:yes gene_type:complete
MKQINIIILLICLILVACNDELPLTTSDEYRKCNTITSPDFTTEKELETQVKTRMKDGSSSYNDSVEYYNLMGSQFIYQKKYKSAIRLLKRACQLDSNISYTFTNLAMAYSELGDYSKAIEILEVAERLCPNHSKVLNDKGYNLLELGRFDESESYLKKTIRLYPKEKKSYGNLLVLYDRSNDTVRLEKMLSVIDSNLWIDTSASKLLRTVITKYDYKIKNYR